MRGQLEASGRFGLCVQILKQQIIHNSLSSAKTSLHTFARISVYNFHSFKEKSPHNGDSGQLSAFPPNVGCHTPSLTPAQAGSLYLQNSWPRSQGHKENAGAKCRDFLRRNILGEEDIIES